ncbi:MAG: CheR family methyltransferase, partial [Candidatus Limnocylindrales bacterium]
IGSVLCDLLAAGNPPAEGRDHDELSRILERIHDRSGIDFGSYKPATIQRRLRGRLSATGSPNLAAYAAYLESDTAEYARLINSFLIKVTEFFRDPKVFDYLQAKVLPELIAEATREGRELRIWSAGCATGEEAYSLAIVVAEAVGEDLPWPKVRIFATDVDRQAIHFARRGIYPAGAINGLPAGTRNRYFVKSDGGYEVDRRLRSQMVFSEHDLAERASFPSIDLLLCRNVLIYFGAPMQRVALETFAASLRPGGRLVLGVSESVAALPDPFEVEQTRQSVFRRRPGSSETTPAPDGLGARRTHESPLDRAIRATHQDVRQVAESSESADRLLLGMTVGVVVVDSRYHILRINSAARRMLGIHGTAYGQDFIDLAEVLPSSSIRMAIDSAITGKTTSAVFEVEPVVATSDALRSLEATVRPYRVEKNAIEGAVVELTDVTALERERRAGGRTRARLDKAVATNTRLLRANDELTEAVAELRSSNESMLLAGEDAQATRTEVETVKEEFQATNEELETLNEELTTTVEELRVANEDLVTRTDQLSFQALVIERERLDSREDADRLRSILASLGDAVVAVDHGGRIVTTNDAYLRFFGAGSEYEPEDMAGLPIPVADRPEQRAARGERFRVEFAVAQPDGARRWFEAVAEPLTAGDRAWGGVLTIRDLSERTMRRSLERLMASAGHELKTPVAALHGYLQLVERDLGPGASAQAHTYTARALAQTRQLGELVERLFDVSRIQAGRFDLVTSSIDLLAVVRAAVEVGQGLPNAPIINMSSSSGPITLQGDASRLRQVFVNLVSNAVDHASCQTIDVAVSREGSVGVVEVRDDGQGIAGDVLPSLFQPYTRLGHKPSAGLGLGLYLAREIVTAHGGTVNAESTRGEGTVMTVRLPLDRSHAIGRVRSTRKARA